MNKFSDRDPIIVFEQNTLAIIKAIESVRAETEMETFISISTKRHSKEGIAEAHKRLDACEWFQKKHPDKAVFVTGFDMDGNEDNDHKAIPEHFYEVFERASRNRRHGGLGLECACHAGEHSGPSDIWSALKLPGIQEISHCLSAIEDANLLSELVNRGILIDQLLISNAQLQADRFGNPHDQLSVSSKHPLPILHANDCFLALGSDDPGIQGTNIADDYRAAARLGISRAGRLGFTANAIRFMPEDVRERLMGKVNAYARQYGLAAAADVSFLSRGRGEPRYGGVAL